MQNIPTLLFLAIVLCTAVLAVGVTTHVLMRLGIVQRPPPRPGRSADLLHHYRFRDDYLLSDIPADDAFLEPDTDRSSALRQLVETLNGMCPDLKGSLETLRDRGQAFLLDARIGEDQVSIGGRRDGDDLVLTVGPSGETANRQMVEVETLESLKTELADLRVALDNSSALMWREDERRRVLWANAAYVELVERVRGGETPGFPIPQLFSGQLEPVPTNGTLRRCKIDLPDRQDPAWFEISRDPLPGGASLFTANPIDKLVGAETALRTFLQTSTKTFAALPIGLAVFDRRRELVTFNPALLTLTDLPFDFLSTRPDLARFLDGLRERQRIPEPRNYKAWRDEIARLEEGAESGTYQELWELPDGKSMKVLGRPHPDGAIAFMFEDISAEMSLTPKFHGDLAMFQAVLDTLPVGVAVFEADGQMLGCNDGYTRLWGHDPAMLDRLPSLGEATALWSARCEPSGFWGEIRQFVAHEVDRGPWVEQICTRDGLPLAVRMEPARGRATVVQFIPLDNSMIDPLGSLATSSATPLLDAARAAGQPQGSARRA